MSKKLQKQLLNWYDKHRRVMPWRAAAGKKPDPYHIWLSEIMLQQTTVAAVGPYFQAFIKRWPRVQDLAQAKQDEVLAQWAGLGYYARARNLHKCAQKIVSDHNGKLPQNLEQLLDLPGIGPYTAAAMASIAFDIPAVAVDGNVERVVSRYFAVQEPLPKSKPQLQKLAAGIAKEITRAGDFTQAFMELGATVCTPRKPKCSLCPWQKTCAAYKSGIAESLPRKIAKKKKPQRRAIAFWQQKKDGRFLIEKRPEKGLFAGMYQLPMQEDTKITKLNKIGSIAHSFTHFDLVLDIYQAPAPKTSLKRRWILPQDMAQCALPSLMRKAISLCLKKATS